MLTEDLTLLQKTILLSKPNVYEAENIREYRSQTQVPRPSYIRGSLFPETKEKKYICFKNVRITPNAGSFNKARGEYSVYDTRSMQVYWPSSENTGLSPEQVCHIESNGHLYDITIEHQNQRIPKIVEVKKARSQNH